MAPPLSGNFANGVVQTFFLEELQLRGAFAARQDEAVTTFEVSDGAHFNGTHAEFVKHLGVRLKVSLDGEDTDFHGVLARKHWSNRLQVEILRAQNALRMTIAICVVTKNVNGSPATSGQKILFFELANVDAGHGFAQLFVSFQNDLRIFEVRGGLHDGFRTRFGIAALENP